MTHHADCYKGAICACVCCAQVPFLLDQFEAVQQCLGPAGRGQHKLSGRPLVILADKNKEDMDSLVRN
jgi:hypothetical protein